MGRQAANQPFNSKSIGRTQFLKFAFGGLYVTNLSNNGYALLQSTYSKNIHVRQLVPGDKRRVMTKNVAILADSLPLSASRHNTMFLKTGNTSCVSILVVFQNQTKASNITTKIKTEGDFE